MSKQWFENFHRYEIRCNNPPSSGMWTAFWVFGWSTEIDGFEFINSSKPEFSLHKWLNSGPISVRSGQQNISGLIGSFHTYAVEHDKFFIRWYIDDKLVFKTSIFFNINNLCELPESIYKRNTPFPDCNLPALQLIVDPGAAPGAETSNNNFPNDFVIDYISVYKRVDNDDSDGCKLSISGPNVTCKRIDTLQYCIEGGNMKGGKWELPLGMTMYQNPALTINKKIIKIGSIDTIIYDTIINKNCIKVISNGLYGSGIVKFIVPEECQFVSGQIIEKNLYFGLPKPNFIIQSSTCNSVRICLENTEPYTEIWSSQEALFETSENKTLCRTFEISFSPKLPPYYYIFFEVKNKCGKSLIPIKIDGKNCIESPPLIDSKFTIIPNPANGNFTINFLNTDTPQPKPIFLKVFILSMNTGTITQSYDINNPEIVEINSSEFLAGEYFILVQDSKNNYYIEPLIINRE